MSGLRNGVAVSSSGVEGFCESLNNESIGVVSQTNREGGTIIQFRSFRSCAASDWFELVYNF